MSPLVAWAFSDQSFAHVSKHLLRQCRRCSKDARARGETEQRLYELNAWRETPFYTPRERAALECTESLALVAQTHVPDEVFEAVRREFTEAEIVDLACAVMAINAWNRMSISMRAVPGTDQPAQKRHPAPPDNPID